MKPKQYQEDPNGFIATFEERHLLGTGEVSEYALTFSNEEGCCLSLPEAPMDDIFFADTKSEIETIGMKSLLNCKKQKQQVWR